MHTELDEEKNRSFKNAKILNDLIIELIVLAGVIHFISILYQGVVSVRSGFNRIAMFFVMSTACA